MTLALRGTALGEGRDGLAAQSAGQFRRIGDGGGGKDEGRADPIEATDPPQPAEDVGHVGAEDPTVAVQLVHHHEGQALEELGPLGVMGQNPLVEHVRIAHHDVAAGAHRLAGIPRGVAVEGIGAHPLPSQRFKFPPDFGQLGHLVLGQGLGGEEIERLLMPTQHRVQDREVVAQGLTGGGRGGDHEVPAGLGQIEGLALVGVELCQAAVDQGLPQTRGQIGGEVELTRRGRRMHQFPADPGAVTLDQAVFEPDDRLDGWWQLARVRHRLGLFHRVAADLEREVLQEAVGPAPDGHAGDGTANGRGGGLTARGIPIH